MIRRLSQGMVHAAVAVAITLCPGKIGAATPEIAPAARLHDVTVQTQKDSLLVRVKTAGPAKYRAELVESPYRLVIDLEDTVYAWRKTPLIVGREPVRQVRGAQYQGDTARVVVELTHKVGYVVRADDDGLAIIVPMTPAVPTAAGKILPLNGAANGTTPVVQPVTALPTFSSTTNGHTAANGETARPLLAQAQPSEEQPKPEAAKPEAAKPAPAPRPVKVVQAQPPAPAPGATRPPVTLEFKDADIVSLLRVLATEGGRNIVIGEDVKGKMSISLRNVPWELALQTILESRGLERVDR